jgi:hypothetical protein
MLFDRQFWHWLSESGGIPMNPETILPTTTEVEKVKIYEAFGGISGVLDTTDDHCPVLLVDDLTYPVFLTRIVQKKHQPGVIQHFIAYAKIFNGKLGFTLLSVSSKPRTTFNLKGCWEVHRGVPQFNVYLNLVPPSYSTSSILNLVWDDAPPADGQYWELVAELRENSFVVLQSIGPFASPPRSQESRKKKKQNSQALPVSESNSPPVAKPILLADKLLVAPSVDSTVTLAQDTSIKSDVLIDAVPPAIPATVSIKPKKSTKVIEPVRSEVLDTLPEIDTPKATKNKASGSKKLPVAPSVDSTVTLAQDASIKPDVLINAVPPAIPATVSIKPKKSTKVIEPVRSEVLDTLPEIDTPKATKNKASGSKKLPKQLPTATTVPASKDAPAKRLFLGKQLASK